MIVSSLLIIYGGACFLLGSALTKMICNWQRRADAEAIDHIRQAGWHYD